MRVTVETQLSAISKQAWNKLLQNSASNTVFQTHEWHESVLCGSGPGHREVYFLCVYEDCNLLCIAPFAINVVWSGERVLEFIGHGFSDFAGFIYDKARPDALQVLLTFVKSEWDLPWHYMVLKSVSASLEHPKDFIEKLRQAGFYGLVFEKSSSAAARLRDANFLSEIHGKRKLRQQLKRLTAMGQYEVLHLSAYDEIEAYLEAFFKQHIDQWANSSTPSFFTCEGNKVFYRRFLLLMSRNHWVNFSAIVLDGKPIAFGLSFTYGNTFLYYKTCYDVAYQKKSPGSVLLLELINYATRCGFDEFSFGAGFEGYKTRFSNMAVDTYTYQVFGGQVRYIIYALALALVKRLKEIRGGRRILNAVKHIFGYKHR